MAKYYFKCEDCNKTIKKASGNFEGIPLCTECRKKRTNNKTCLNCGEKFWSGKSARKYCSTSCCSKHTLTGRKLSKKHREKLSQSAFNNSLCTFKGAFKGVKYYKVFCPYLNKDISVQGTYELKYAKYLNENNKKWTREKNINLRYIKNGIKKTYYPDFYLVDENIYIETKGYFPEDAQEKMNLVKEYNKEAKIKILFKEDLEKLNIL
jgi:hypothetical protein